MQINNIGILSPGDMGSAVGKVLIDNGYKVFTNLEGRSERTKKLSEKPGLFHYHQFLEFFLIVK